MNTNNQKRAHRTPVYRRPAVILTFLAILAVVAAIVIIIFANIDQPDSADQANNNNSVNSSTSSSADSSSNSSTSTDDGWESKVPQYEGENVNANHELSGSILRKDADLAAQTLTVYAMIDQYFNDGGTCTLLLKKSGNVVFRTTVAAEADITTSICEPITISTAQIDSGTYEIEIQLSGNNKTGIIKEEVEL